MFPAPRTPVVCLHDDFVTRPHWNSISEPPFGTPSNESTNQEPPASRMYAANPIAHWLQPSRTPSTPFTSGHSTDLPLPLFSIRQPQPYRITSPREQIFSRPQPKASHQQIPLAPFNHHQPFHNPRKILAENQIKGGKKEISLFQPTAPNFETTSASVSFLTNPYRRVSSKHSIIF